MNVLYYDLNNPVIRLYAPSLLLTVRGNMYSNRKIAHISEKKEEKFIVFFL